MDDSVQMGVKSSIRRCRKRFRGEKLKIALANPQASSPADGGGFFGRKLNKSSEIRFFATI
jgi:hypothetical protein